MTIHDAILAVVKAQHPSSIHGRTRFQKKMYFLSVLSDEYFGFRPHFYGPYSSAVSTSLSATIEAGFIDETRVGHGVITPLGELIRYDYCLNESGEEVIEHRPEIVEPYLPLLSKINESGVDLDINTISIAAKVHFILSDQGESTSEQIRDEANDLGWNFSPQSIDRAVKYLEHLDLVTLG